MASTPFDHEPRASLFSVTARGGRTSLEGFDAQRRYALIWLIESMTDPDFAAILIEGAEDIEARFNRQSGAELYAVQVKNYRVTMTKVREIINHFRLLDEASPGTWASFIIACAKLDRHTGKIHSRLQLYRSMSKGEFYGEKNKILADTRHELLWELEKAGLPAEFVLERVAFEPNLNLYGQDEWVQSRARDLLQGLYPHVDRESAQVIYLQLWQMVSSSIGEAITRGRVEEAIQAELDG